MKKLVLVFALFGFSLAAMAQGGVPNKTIKYRNAQYTKQKPVATQVESDRSTEVKNNPKHNFSYVNENTQKIEKGEGTPRTSASVKNGRIMNSRK